MTNVPSAVRWLREIARAWIRTEGPFKRGARYKAATSLPIVAVLALTAAILEAWTPAIVGALVTVGISMWLLNDLRGH